MTIPDVVTLRRDLHAHAEPGFLEYRTAATVVSSLRQLDIPHRTGAGAMDMGSVPIPPTLQEQEEWAARVLAAGAEPDLVEHMRTEGTALVGDIEGDRPGPAWGLRIDMDALPIAEDDSPAHRPAAEGFGSRTPYMHACGHDGHTAIGLALADRLADRDFPGTVRLLFQPAEEGVRGALPMIRAGVLDGVERMLAVHLGGDLQTGTVVAGQDGALATTKWRTTFTGVPAHASGAPEQGRNALAAAAQATLGILGLTRFSNADTRVNVGTFHADGVANIIPASATITYETRSSTNEVLDRMNQLTTSVVQGAAQMYDVIADSQVSGGSATSSADAERIADIRRAAVGVPAVTDLIDRNDGMFGSDDAHLMILDVQRSGGTGSYIMVGGANPAPHHHPRFDVDEQALGIAVDLLEAVFRSPV
jgi:aminobenzoyl-glutamate utilization protein A